MKNIIEVKNLVKRYPYYEKKVGVWNSIKALFYRKKLYKTAVDNISFNIKEGEMVAFLGPNGAGKTTTLKMLSGILHKDKGNIDVLGFYPYDKKRDFQKQFSIIMGSKAQLITQITVMDNFIFFKSIYDLPKEEFNRNLNELIDLLSIKDILNIQVKKLSLGQRMKCELIASLLHKPRILFLDEPTIGLDVIAQKNIRDFIKKYNKESKTTIILTSHYMHDVEELCDRVIVINFGKIIYDGSLPELIKRHQGDSVDELDADAVMRLVFEGDKNFIEDNNITAFIKD